MYRHNGPRPRPSLYKVLPYFVIVYRAVMVVGVCILYNSGDVPILYFVLLVCL